MAAPTSTSPSVPAQAAAQPVRSEPQGPLMRTYVRADLAFERGQGAWLETADGARYLDFAAGVAVNSLGHAHPHLVAALKAQADKLWHTSNLYRIPEGERLAARLVEHTFADVVFFTNSGAEAMECSIKLARKYHAAQGRSERYRIITFEGAFHGRTLATIAAGGQQKYIEGFGPKVDGFDQVPFGDHKALEAAITSETAAILVEPIQGEGGIRPIPPQCLRGLRELCDKNGLLLMFDEVQTGVGRTGKFLAHEWSGVKPDVVAIAKGIGGGFPMGACLATVEAAEGMTAGVHGSTFGGNPLAMAVGNAVLDVILSEGFLSDVERKGLFLKQGLASLVDRYQDVFTGLRGEGLMMGLRTVSTPPEFVAAARGEGLLLVGAGDNVVRLLPPLIVSDQDLQTALTKLELAAQRMRASLTPSV
jgi:acetylornithine/N-succinyldiaminopimelate aminotransferase